MTKASGIIACVVLGLTSLALPACSSKSDSGTPSGGTPSQADECKAYYKAKCDKVYECFTAEEIASADVPFGTSKADCPAALEAASPCTQDACEPGQTFNSANATKCIDALAATSCSDVTGGADAPAVCGEVCTGDATPGGSGNDGAALIAECKKVYSLQCHKIFTCFSADELAAAVDIVGKDESECASLSETEAPCTADFCGGGTFDATHVDSCNAALTAQTCDDFTAADSNVPECDAICSN